MAHDDADDGGDGDDDDDDDDDDDVSFWTSQPMHVLDMYSQQPMGSGVPRTGNTMHAI